MKIDDTVDFYTFQGVNDEMFITICSPDSVDRQPIGPFECDRNQRVAPIAPFDVVSLQMVHSWRILVYFVLLVGDSNTLDAHFGRNAAEVHAAAPVDSDSFAVESCHSSCPVATDIAFFVDPVDRSCAADKQLALVPAFALAVA